MILRSPTEDENGDLRHAGMVAFASGSVQSSRFKVQRPFPQLETRNTEPGTPKNPDSKDASGEKSMSAWIPALHAGMTQSNCTKTDHALLIPDFQKSLQTNPRPRPKLLFCALLTMLLLLATISYAQERKTLRVVFVSLSWNNQLP